MQCFLFVFYYKIFVSFTLWDLFALNFIIYELYQKERVRKMGFLYIFIFKELSTADETLRATKLE